MIHCWQILLGVLLKCANTCTSPMKLELLIRLLSNWMISGQFIFSIVVNFLRHPDMFVANKLIIFIEVQHCHAYLRVI